METRSCLVSYMDPIRLSALEGTENHMEKNSSQENQGVEKTTDRNEINSRQLGQVKTNSYVPRQIGGMCYRFRIRRLHHNLGN